MAAYKYNVLASKDVIWAAQTGAELKVTVQLVQETSDYYGNGDYQPTRNSLSITLQGYVAGEADGNSSSGVTMVADKAPVVAAVGRIGLRQGQLEAINAAIVEVKSHPEWVAKMDAIQRGEQAAREYRAHVKAVDDMMTLNGRSK